MNGHAPKADPIDAAIAKAETVQMLPISVTIASTGRPFQVAVPLDMTDAELVEAAGWMLTQLANHLRTERAKTPAGRILVPGRMA